MIVFNSKPLINIPPYGADVSNEERKFITAVLIEEHGVLLSKDNSTYSLRSPIFTKGGIGNVVLDVYPRKKDIKLNQFYSVGSADLTKDSTVAAQKLSDKFGVNISSGVRWTGSENNAKVYEYAQFESFSDYVKYAKQRFNLPAGLQNRQALSAQLSRYSGQVAGYSGAVLNIMSNVSMLLFSKLTF